MRALVHDAGLTNNRINALQESKPSIVAEPVGGRKERREVVGKLSGRKMRRRKRLKSQVRNWQIYS